MRVGELMQMKRALYRDFAPASILCAIDREFGHLHCCTLEFGARHDLVHHAERQRFGRANRVVSLKVPVRHGVLSLPIPLRLPLAAQPELITPVLQVVQRVLARYLLGQAGLKVGEGDYGSVTLIQRFGSAANLNIHLHCLVLGGVYRISANGGPEFIEIPAPSNEDIWEELQRIIRRVMRQLVRRGILVEDQGETYLADDVDDSKEARVLRLLQKGSCVYRIALGLRAGQKVLTLQGALPREVSGKQRLCAKAPAEPQMY